MATRTDVHRPSEINPADYAFVGFEFLPSQGDPLSDAEIIRSERRRIRAHMDRTGGKYSNHQHGGNCHICGSVNAIYTALFHHKPSNVYIRTGLDCTDKLDSSIDGERFRRNVGDARQNAVGKRKAKATLEAAGLSAAWDVFTGTPQQEGYFAGSMGNQGFGERSTKVRYEESTICDIVGKLVKYGSISPAQTAFIGKLLQKITDRAEIEAKRAAETESAKPIPVVAGRMTIRGKVLTVKRTDDEDFFRHQMLVQHADGWKVWGSVPSVISDVQRGAVVEFDARVEAKDGDPKFGFFSRPTKAKIVE